MSEVYLITGAQSRMARSLLKWSRERLAHEANVSRGTIRIFEDDQPIRESIVLDIHSVFDANGVECCPDGSVRPRSDNIMDFRGIGGCDRFFAEIERMLKERNTGIVCRIGSQKMLTRVTGRNGITNFDRLEYLSKIASVRCLLLDQRIYLPGKPSFEVRVYPEVRPSIIASEFAFGDKATFAIDQDDRYNFCHPAYMVLEYPSLAKNMFDHFEKHWSEATPYLPSKKGASNLSHRVPTAADFDEPKRQACY